MKHKISIILIFLIFFSCAKKHSLFGIYKNSIPTKNEKKKYSTNLSIIGSTLSLSKDSTYSYRTCGFFMYGKWEVKKDSLYLLKKNIRYFNDSINEINKPSSNKSITHYLITNNYLIRNLNGINNPKEIILEKLIKE